MFQNLKAKMSDDGSLCFLCQFQTTGDTDRALFFKLFTKLEIKKKGGVVKDFPLGDRTGWE